MLSHTEEIENEIEASGPLVSMGGKVFTAAIQLALAACAETRCTGGKKSWVESNLQSGYKPHSRLLFVCFTTQVKLFFKNL